LNYKYEDAVNGNKVREITYWQMDENVSGSRVVGCYVSLCLKTMKERSEVVLVHAMEAHGNTECTGSTSFILNLGA